MKPLLKIRKYYYWLLMAQDSYFSMLACHAMKWRKFSYCILHPKHIFDEERGNYCSQYLKPRINFLDLGCGVGSDCITAYERGAEIVVGIEMNKVNIDIAVNRAEKNGMKIEFILHDLDKAGFPLNDSIFDVVNFSNVLEHLENRIEVLKELKRVKKEDGIAIISIPNADTSWKRKLRSMGLDSRDDPDHKIEYSKKSIKEELKEANLEIISELHPIIPSFPWNGLIAISAAISPQIYRKFQVYKRKLVQRFPEESIGWVFSAR